MVERFDATSITGWAAGADGAIGELQLRIDEQPVTLPIRRFDRHDVADALGAPRGGLYGFEVMLPPWIWSLVPPRGESRITVCADGQPINRPMTLSCAPFNTWLRRYAAVIPGTTGAPLAPNTPGAGAIDGIDGLLVSGWLRNPPDSNAPIEVLCAGQPIDCTIVSVDRPEVRAALGSASQASGFEFLLPGLIWQHSDASGSLQIHVRAGGQDLSASPLRIEATLLEREIANLRAADPASAQHGSVLDPAECQYRSLLLLEHATAVPSIANLSSSASDWLREEAARYGLIGTLAKRHAEGALADQSPINLPADDGTAVHWRVLRDINDRLAGGAHEIWPAFADAFAKTTTTEQRWQLLGATMPTICTLGYAPRLQGYVDQAVLARLTQADDVWGLSLALAIVAAQGDIAQATELLERMLPLMHHGWLNTECMHAAATLVVERLSHGDIEPPVAESFFSALVKTLESYGHVHASRTHDHQLIACMTTLLRGSPWMTDATCRRVAQVALRRFGLQPDFWRLIDADVSNGELSVGDPLRAARATFDRIHARLQQGQWARWPDLQHLDDELQPLRTLGCGECDIVQRQALQALLQLDEKPDAEAIRSLLAVSERMSREEVLRSVAFPGAHGGDIISALDDMSDRIRAFRIVATNPNLTMQRAACEGLLELSRAARSAPIAIDAAAVDELTA